MRQKGYDTVAGLSRGHWDATPSVHAGHPIAWGRDKVHAPEMQMRQEGSSWTWTPLRLAAGTLALPACSKDTAAAYTSPNLSAYSRKLPSLVKVTALQRLGDRLLASLRSLLVSPILVVSWSGTAASHAGRTDAGIEAENALTQHEKPCRVNPRMLCRTQAMDPSQACPQHFESSCRAAKDM